MRRILWVVRERRWAVLAQITAKGARVVREGPFTWTCVHNSGSSRGGYRHSFVAIVDCETVRFYPLACCESNVENMKSRLLNYWERKNKLLRPALHQRTLKWTEKSRGKVENADKLWTQRNYGVTILRVWGVLHCSYAMLDFYFRSAGENCLIAVEGQLCAF